MHNHSVFDTNSDLPPEIIFQYESIFVNTSINYATVALVFYEYLTTLPDEVKYFWGRRLTGASVLFFANRYLVLAYSAALLRGARPFTKHASLPLFVFRLGPNADGGLQSCVQWSEGVRAVEILAYLPWAALSGLRVYALRGCGNSGWPLGTFVFLLSIVPMCINFADFRWARLVSETLWGCSEAILEPPGLSIRLTIVSRASLILADLTATIITWMATFASVRMLGDRHTLSGVLLWNGTVYFIILLLLNTMHLAFCVRSIFQSAAHSHVSDVVVLIEPLTSILVSRLMLELQQTHSRLYAHSRSGSLGAASPAAATSLAFERVLGSIKMMYSDAARSDSDSDSDYHSDYYDDVEREGRGDGCDDDRARATAGEWWIAGEAAPPPSESEFESESESEKGAGERSGCQWENPFRDVKVEAAGTASLTDMSFRTGSSSVFSYA